jgi:hypothetical protein
MFDYNSNGNANLQGMDAIWKYERACTIFEETTNAFWKEYFKVFSPEMPEKKLENGRPETAVKPKNSAKSTTRD